MTADKKNQPSYIPFVLGILIIVHFIIRLIMAHSPFLAESYYDEAVTGEMALRILKGEHQLFFWGQPYMGALEAYLNAPVILLVGSSAFALRYSTTLISIFMLLLVNRIGSLAGDWRSGLLSAAFWALGPLYLSIIGLLATGGHVEACAFGAFIILSLSILIFRSPENKGLLAALIGIIAGLAWWSSLLAAPFLLAGVLVLSIGKPRLLLTRITWIGLAGFLIGSSPFWLWEWLHDFSTFGFFEGHGVGLLRQLVSGLYTVLRFSLAQTFLGDWWDGHSVLPSVPSFLVWAVFILIYLPVFFLSLYTIFQWFRRMAAFRTPFQGPLDLVVAVFWILTLSFATSEQGSNGSLRYSLSLYIPVSILVGLWLRKLFQFRVYLGAAFIIGLLLFNVFLHQLFLKEFKDQPYRPIDQLIRTLKDHGIRYAYADNRISQVLTFESGESIICADYYGQRNFNYLRMVDAAPADQVAIVTHQKLGNPYPEAMAAALKLLGGSFKRGESGAFVFWYHFQEPRENLSPIPPQDWRVAASQGQEQIPLMVDRDILTSWSTPKHPGDYVSVDLGKELSIARISLLPGIFGIGLPNGLKVEISLDGRNWKALYELGINDMIGGLYWYHGRPRMAANPRLQISFSPQLARYIRLSNLTKGETPHEPWTIAELFIYEAVENPESPSEKRGTAYSRAEEALDHWMDDPAGPHPLFPGVNLKTRRRQVQWPLVIHLLQDAIHECPDWEEPYFLFGLAVDWGGLAEGNPREKKVLNYNALFNRPDSSIIPTTHFKVTSNLNTAQAGLAVDRDPSTRWTSLKPQSPGMFFQVELDNCYNLNGISLFLGGALNDYPRALRLQGSLNGKDWQDLQIVPLSLYALSGGRIYKKTYYTFSPISLRYLKLIQESKTSSYWWSIYELEILEKRL